MNFLLIALLLTTLITLPGCFQKKWWEDCYESEEAAMIDELQCEIADLRDELRKTRYYR